jgi:hypothetical protein
MAMSNNLDDSADRQISVIASDFDVAENGTTVSNFEAVSARRETTKPVDGQRSNGGRQRALAA